MRRPILALIVASLAATWNAYPHPLMLHLQPVPITVDASRTIGSINRNLVGVDWKFGTGDGVDDLHPDLARADIAFQIAAKPDGSFDWSFADAWVAEAQAAGAEPMLILNYMPPWLARTYPSDPRDPTRLRPRDYAEWERIVEAGVEHFAVDHGVRWFEVWNEPDWAGFWQDSPAAFLETAKHTAIRTAVAAAASAAGKRRPIPLPVASQRLRRRNEPGWTKDVSIDQSPLDPTGCFHGRAQVPPRAKRNHVAIRYLETPALSLRASMSIRVVLAEDNYLVREGVSRLLESQPDVELVAVAEDLPSLERAVDEHEPDVVVTDIRMPPTSTDEGIQASERLRETHPECGVVVLSQFAEPGYVLALLEKGSAGRAYLLKERVSDVEQLLGAIREVAKGGSVIDPKVVEVLVAARSKAAESPLARLTPREREILGEMAQGRNNASVAASLFLTERAVEKHINSIFSKLGLSEEKEVHRRVKAVLLFLSEGTTDQGG